MLIKKKSIYLAGLIAASFLIGGCSSLHKSHKKSKKGPLYYGVAVMNPTKSSQAEDYKVSGTVVFSESFGKVRVEADIKGLKPNKVHGFHIHEWGDCRAEDATSAGGHYNPEGHPHAGPDKKEKHAGDLGNLTADKLGNAKLNIMVSNLSVAGRLNPIIGRSVIIHKEADDLISQPTGGAGDRLACGVIGAATR